MISNSSNCSPIQVQILQRFTMGGSMPQLCLISKAVGLAEELFLYYYCKYYGAVAEEIGVENSSTLRGMILSLHCRSTQPEA